MSSENPPHRLNPRIHLERAQGFFELEMFNEAEVELRAVPENMPWLKPKRALLIFLYQEKKEWKLMKEQAKGLRIDFPEEEDWWVSKAYATRRADSVEEAREVLLEGLTLNFESAIIRYNLACARIVESWRMHGFLEGSGTERSKIQDFGFRR